MPEDLTDKGVGGESGGYPVLVVHGDPAARGLIADALRLEGFRTVAGGHWDALRALEALRGEPPRAVLLDLDGRDANGHGVSAFTAAFGRRHHDVPIIGLSTAPHLRDGSAVGAALLVAEPFELDYLIEAVTRLCNHN